MSDKYIIRNCPALSFSLGFYCDEYQKKCQDCTDCLLKQIVEKCKGELGRVRTIGKDILADEILQLFEIEECETPTNNVVKKAG